MFTGLIEEIGKVQQIRRGAVNRVDVSCENVAGQVVVGDSVAVNGACLTVTAIISGGLSFDFVRETALRTTLGKLKAGDEVNLETSLRAGEPLGGHFVLGHVDGVCAISSIKNIGDSREIGFSAGPDLLKFVVQKGSIAIDGISLTIADYDSAGFKIALIPHSLEHTTLKHKKIGDRVNVETDILGKYVYRLISGTRDDNDSTMDLLKKSGFL